MTVIIAMGYADYARGHIDRITAIRINNQWMISATYTATVDRTGGGCRGSVVTNAIMPLIAMVHASDTLVCQSQRDCDALKAITRRHVSGRLGRRCVIKPYCQGDLTGVETLEDMITKLRIAGITVSDWIGAQ